MTTKIELSEQTYRKLMDFVARRYLHFYSIRKIDSSERPADDIRHWADHKGDFRFDELFDLLEKECADTSIVLDFLNIEPKYHPKYVRRILKTYVIKKD